jgi:hypothetical protein
MKLLEEDTTMSYHVMNKTMQASIHMTCYELLVIGTNHMRARTTKHPLNNIYLT